MDKKGTILLLDFWAEIRNITVGEIATVGCRCDPTSTGKAQAENACPLFCPVSCRIGLSVAAGRELLAGLFAVPADCPHPGICACRATNNTCQRSLAFA